MDESFRGPLIEGAPIEPIEDLPLEISGTASQALEEIKGIQLARSENGAIIKIENENGPGLTIPEKSSTEAVTNLKAWLREEMKNSPNFDKNVVKIMVCLKNSGFAMEDERVPVREKIYEITQLLDRFISNPNDFRVKYPDLTNKLISFCENLSR